MSIELSDGDSNAPIRPSALWPHSKHVEDMPHWSDEAAANSRLQAALHESDRVLTPRFRKFDQAAVKQQNRHRWIVRLAAIIGTIAVTVSILSLAAVAQGTLWEIVEIGATAFALAAVCLGLWAAFQREWLLSRYRAERLRAAKFTYLIEPAAWSMDETKAATERARLVNDAAQIATETFSDLDRWLEDLGVVEPPEFPPDAEVDPLALQELVAYYRLKRLGKQAWFYYDRATNKDKAEDALTRLVPQFAFFGSIFAALIGLGIRAAMSLSGSDTSPEVNGLATSNRAANVTIVLALASATLPLFGACVRTIRGSREFTRNRLRYRAGYQALVHADERLGQLLAHVKQPAPVLRELWYAEKAVDAELREWLRLMREADWYG